jgi:hypothetical protein
MTDAATHQAKAANPAGQTVAEPTPRSATGSSAADSGLRAAAAEIVARLGRPATEPAAERAPEEEGDAPESTGAPAQDERDPAQENEDPTRYRVKVRGEEREVTLEELRKGYSRTEDYKQKTAALAQERRRMDAERDEIAAERHRNATELDAMATLVRQLDPVLARAARTDWHKLAASDPTAHAREWQAYQARLQEIGSLSRAADAARETDRKTHFEREEKLLAERVPEWAEPGKCEAGLGELREALVKRYGFSPEEVRVFPNHRTALVARDAIRFQELTERTQAAQRKKVQPPPRMQKPSSGLARTSGSRLDAMKETARRTGRLNDRAAYVLAALQQE